MRMGYTGLDSRRSPGLYHRFLDGCIYLSWGELGDFRVVMIMEYRRNYLLLDMGHSCSSFGVDVRKNCFGVVPLLVPVDESCLDIMESYFLLLRAWRMSMLFETSHVEPQVLPSEKVALIRRKDTTQSFRELKFLTRKLERRANFDMLWVVGPFAAWSQQGGCLLMMQSGD